MTKIVNRKATQHNHLVNARFDMSTYEMRLFITMLSRISKTDTDFKECSIHISDFMDHSTGGKTYTIIKEACVSLSKKVIQIESMVEGKNGGMKKKFVVLPLMAMATYQEGEATITAQFNNKLKPYLLNLAGNFTQAEIRQLFKLKSFYSYRLYWLLKQYQTFGERYIELGELREMLNLQEKYDRFQDFKVKVINAAMRELKDTDMAFTYEPVKKGKTVVGIRFYFSPEESAHRALEANKGQQALFTQYEEVVLPQAVNESPDTVLGGKISVRETLAKFKLSNLQINRIIQRVSSDDIYKTAYLINLHLMDNKQLVPAAYAYNEFERRYFPKDKESK